MNLYFNNVPKLAIVVSALAVSGFAQAQTKQQATSDNYVSFGVNATRSIYNMGFENPRISQISSGPTKPSSTTLSIALGRSLGDGWRGEFEFVTPSKKDYESHWNPFPTFRQKVTIDTHRLMANGIKDFPLSKEFSLNASFGLGWASVKTSGAQSAVANGPATNPFGTKTKNNLAYSLGFGGEYKFDKSASLTLGLRRVELGTVESGMSQFGLNDERYKGRVRSDELSVGWKQAF